MSKFIQLYKQYDWNSKNYLAGNFIELKKSIPNNHGVYIFRAPYEIQRVRGASDIIYIGQSGGGKRSGAQGVGGRLFNTRGVDKWVREKIESLYPNINFKIEYHFTDEQTDPKDIEETLLKAYLDDHYELPPANHQSVKL